MCRRRNATAGFSLVELVVSVAILGILMAAGMPVMSEWISNSRVRSAAESVLRGLQLARFEAIRSNSRVEFQLVGTNGGWQVTREAVGDSSICSGNFTGGTVIQTNVATSSNNAVILAAFSDTLATTGTAANVFIFGPNGWCACCQQGKHTIRAQFQSLNFDTTALGADYSRDLRIVMPRGGGARLCDPHVSSTDTRACPT